MTALAVERAIETVPSHWGRIRFKAALHRSDERNDGLRYQLLSLTSAGTVVARSAAGDRQPPSEESVPRYFVVRPTDLVINPMWLIGGAIGVSGGSGAVSPDYRVFHVRFHNPRFLHHLLRSQPYRDQYRLFARAETTFDRRIQQGDLDHMVLPLPSLDEQQAIADYLDVETSKIDTLIAKQQQLIDTLRERRVVITQTSLDGLAWSTPLRSVSSLIQTGPFGSQLKSDEYEDGGTPVINPSHLVVGQIVDDPRVAVGPAKAAALVRHALQLNDLVAARRGELGRVALVRPAQVGYLCGTGSAIVRPRLEMILPEYLALAFGSRRTREALSLSSVGSTMDNLNVDIIGALRVPVPPIEVQRKIVVHVDRETAKIDTLIAKTERFIELARERRSALITAAVTGQIDLRPAPSAS